MDCERRRTAVAAAAVAVAAADTALAARPCRGVTVSVDDDDVLVVVGGVSTELNRVRFVSDSISAVASGRSVVGPDAIIVDDFEYIWLFRLDGDVRRYSVLVSSDDTTPGFVVVVVLFEIPLPSVIRPPIPNADT